MKPDLISVSKSMFLPPHFAELESTFTVHYLPPPAERPAFLKSLADKVRFAQATGTSGLDKAMIDALPKLEIIACVGVGVDSIDVPYAKSKGIKVTNTPNVLNDCVADLAIGLMISAARGLAGGDQWVRRGTWVDKGIMPLGRRVARKRLGILGLGKIGKAIAKRASAFDMEIAYYGRHKQDDVPFRYFSDLAEMAANVDYLVVICPGGPATRHLVNEKVLRALGPKGILINVARGSVVDEAALVKVLQEKALGGAALDVFEKEPCRPAELAALDNVVLAPHLGSATTETRIDMGNLAIANLKAHLDGKPLLTPV
ncbi:MAG TPA: 2-hydroxyacid dehydrogenase [Alphaproteobacteria bacterium]